MEIVDFVLRVRIGITAAVPASIVVNGISIIIIFDGVVNIVTVVRLPASTRNPNNAGKTILAYFFDDRLEIIVQSLLILLIVFILQTYWFVGQL